MKQNDDKKELSNNTNAVLVEPKRKRSRSGKSEQKRRNWWNANKERMLAGKSDKSASTKSVDGNSNSKGSAVILEKQVSSIPVNEFKAVSNSSVKSSSVNSAQKVAVLNGLSTESRSSADKNQAPDLSSQARVYKIKRPFIDWQASFLGVKVGAWIAYQRLNFEKASIVRVNRLQARLKKILAKRFLSFRTRVVLKGILGELGRNKSQFLKFQRKEDKREARLKWRKKRRESKPVHSYKIFIRETLNNMFLVVFSPKGKMLITSSLGMHGLKGAKRCTPYGAELAGRRLGIKMRQRRIFSADAILRSARTPLIKAVFKGFSASRLRIRSISNEAIVAHNGTRKRKLRRI